MDKITGKLVDAQKKAEKLELEIGILKRGLVEEKKRYKTLDSDYWKLVSKCQYLSGANEALTDILGRQNEKSIKSV